MESWRTSALISLVRPAALPLRAEMPPDWACAVGRERMAKAVRPTPPSRPTILRRIGGACNAGGAGNGDSKRGT